MYSKIFGITLICFYKGRKLDNKRQIFSASPPFGRNATFLALSQSNANRVRKAVGGNPGKNFAVYKKTATLAS
jgi:hypothetical protein